MASSAKKPSPVISVYIDSFDKDIKKRLFALWKSVKEAAPLTEETLTYQMPTFKLNRKNLVHFAAFKNHIGFYPTPSAITAFKKELAVYKQSKGAVQFPHTRPLPLALIKKMVRFRVKENNTPSTIKKNASTTLEVCSRGHEFLKSKEIPVCPVCWPGRYKNQKNSSRTRRPRYVMPGYIKQALLQHHVKDAYDRRPPYQQNDYVGWISRAVQETTKQKRLNQMIDELKKGNVYMKMKWKSK